MRVCIHMRIYTHKRVNIIHSYRQTDRHVYIHTYIHTYIQTHTLTHRHVYTHTDRHTRGPHSKTARHGGSSSNAFMPCNLLSREACTLLHLHAPYRNGAFMPRNLLSISFSHPVIAPPPAPPRPSTSATTPAPPSGWPSAPPTFVCVCARTCSVCVCLCVCVCVEGLGFRV
jgi:hypothetical protein